MTTSTADECPAYDLMTAPHVCHSCGDVQPVRAVAEKVSALVVHQLLLLTTSSLKSSSPYCTLPHSLTFLLSLSLSLSLSLCEPLVELSSGLTGRGHRHRRVFPHAFHVSLVVLFLTLFGQVTAIDVDASKAVEAVKVLKADEFVTWADATSAGGPAARVSEFDVILNCASGKIDTGKLLDMLQPNGTLVQVGGGGDACAAVSPEGATGLKACCGLLLVAWCLLLVA